MLEVSLAEIAETMDESVKQHGLEFVQYVTRESFGNGGARMGVFCLTENVRSVLMWSHYANNHYGIAIRFSFTDQIEGGLIPLFKVRYREERAMLRAFFGGEDQAESIMNALCTKAKFWDYEREWRFIEPEGAGKIIHFEPKVVTGVVLGAKTLDADAYWVAEQCAARGIPLMKVVPDDRTFALNFYEARAARSNSTV